MKMRLEHWRNDTDMGNPKYWEKNFANATLSTTNPKRTHFELNPGNRDKETATNRLRHGKALKYKMNLIYI